MERNPAYNKHEPFYVFRKTGFGGASSANRMVFTLAVKRHSDKTQPGCRDHPSSNITCKSRQDPSPPVMLEAACTSFLSALYVCGMEAVDCGCRKVTSDRYNEVMIRRRLDQFTGQGRYAGCTHEIMYIMERWTLYWRGLYTRLRSVK